MGKTAEAAAEAAPAGLIYREIPAIMGELGAVGKNKVNGQQGYRYRDVDGVVNALSPLLSRHGVFILPEVIDQRREERATSHGTGVTYSVCLVRFRFCASDGSFVEAVAAGEAMDAGDKSTGKAVSTAFKQALLQVFCIPTEEQQDAGRQEQQGRDAPRLAALQQPKAQQQGERQGAGELSPEQAALMREAIARAGCREDSVASRYRVARIEDMTAQQYAAAMRALERQERGRGAGKGK